MAVSVEGKIEEAIESRLQTLVTNPVLPMAWTGKPFAAPATKRYLQIIYAPNLANRVFIGSTDPHQRLGVLQINVHWPHGDFERVARDVAGQVAAHFPTDLVISAGGVELRITKAPDVTSALVSGTEITIPVMIEYEAWA
jgi:hypothetical protein